MTTRPAVPRCAWRQRPGQTERERLERQLADITRRQESVLRQAQDSDPDEPFTKALRGSYNQLDVQKTAVLAVIADLDAADQAEPHRPTRDDATLLDALPYLVLNLANAPEPCCVGRSRSPNSPSRSMMETK